MANIQTLSVSLVARTQGFQRGLDSAQGRLKAFSAGALASAGRIAGFGTALAGLVGGAGLASLTKSSFAAIDELGNLSGRLGIGVEDLQAFGHAAALADVSQQSLATGLQLMNRTLGQASLGSRSAQIAFAQLGLNFQSLQAAGPAEAFRTIADRIAALGTASQRAAAAQAIFGRGGVQLLNVLSQGRAGLDASAQELKRFGAVVSEQGTAQVQVADDALKRAQVAFGAIGKVFAVHLAPLITESAERFIAWAQSGGGAAAHIQNALERVRIVLNIIGRVIDGLTAGFQGFAALVLRGAGGIASLFGAEEFARNAKGAADELFASAQKNIDSAFGIEAQNTVTEFFDAAQKRAAETAKTLTAPKLTESLTALSKDQLAGPQAAKRATDIGQGLQIDLARTVLGAVGARPRVQQVESPQLAEIAELLRQMARAAGGGAVAA